MRVGLTKDSSRTQLRLVDTLTGIVNFVAVAELAPSDPSVWVVAAQLADTTRYGLPSRAASNGSGAGLSYSDAYGAAIGECAERYAMQLWYPEEVLFGSYLQMRERGYNPVEPSCWALFHPEQYPSIPFSPFTQDTPIGWVRAESLSFREERLVPACMVYMPYRKLYEGEQEIAPAISTGAACATSIPEALLKGICELIERDAFMIVWRNRLPRPQVIIDPNSELYDVYQEHFARPSLNYTIVYTTLDLSIPSFWGILEDTRHGTPRFIVGGAAHPDPNRALLKTLLELVQGLKWVDHARAETVCVEPGFSNIRLFEDRMRLYAFSDIGIEAFRFAREHPEKILLSEIPNLDCGGDIANLRQIVNMLAQRHLEVVAVDMTTPDLAECGLFVTRVFVPGLETMEGDHTQQFLGGRRWQEVPVQLGILSAPLNLSEINPFPHPYP